MMAGNKATNKRSFIITIVSHVVVNQLLLDKL
jgi:hypothetical protein